MMIHLKDGLSLKAFVHFTVGFLLLTHSCGGQSLIVSQSPVVAFVDDDIILPCYLETAVDVVSRAVEWARADLKPRFVHVRRDGVDLLIDQNPSYIGRTSMSIEQLKRGDISLKLSKVRLSDDGTYKCYIPELNRASAVQLVVGVASYPSISITKDGAAVVLNCESKSWYPEPEVLWLDGEGNLLSAGPAETVRGPDDLYTVSSRVTVEKRHSNRFTCRVQQKDINQTREAHIQVADNVLMVPSCVAVSVSLSLVACFMSILTAVIVWKCRHNKPKKETNMRLSSTSKEQPMAATEDTNLCGKSLMTKDNLEEVVTKLEDHRTDLMKQKEELDSLLQEVKKKLKKNKKKLENPPEYNREIKQKKHKQTKEDLENYEKQLEGLLKNTEKLLKTTDDLITFHSELLKSY